MKKKFLNNILSFFNIFNGNSNLLKYIKKNDIKRFNSELNAFNIYFLDKEKNTLLHHACHYGCIPLIQKLIESGIDVNQLNTQNQSAISFTLIKKATNRNEIINILLENNADIQTLDIYEKNALDYACENSEFNIINNILKYLPPKCINYYSLKKAMLGCDKNYLSSSQTIDILDSFLNHGFDINLTNTNNHNITRYLFAAKKLEIFQYALNKGANIFGLDRENNDLLDFIFKNYHNSGKKFCFMIGEHFLGTDIFPVVIDRMNQKINYSSKAFILELIELNSLAIKNNYEKKLPKKIEKLTIRKKI